jgi:hypothetical protein
MHHPLAITRNRTALLAVVAAIVALLGGREPGAVARRLRKAALALLRPAESAARRLIVMAAQGLVAAPRPAPALALVLQQAQDGGEARAARAPAFRLFDPPKRFGRWLRPAPPAGAPRIRSFGVSAAPLVPFVQPAVAPPLAAPLRPDPEALVDAGPLRRRLAALERALADLPAQARRLARWRARDARAAAARPGAIPHRPLRLGRPPGWRARPDREVDIVLRECHAFALEAARADTS